MGSPVRTVVLPLVIMTVNLNCATKLPGFSVRMGKGTRSSCSRHSLMPMRAAMGSSKELRLKQKEGQRSRTSLKNCRDCLILRLQERSRARLKTVQRRSVSLGFPSPLLTNTSSANTSWTANSCGSTRCSKVSLLMITLLPSMRCFLSSCDSTPSSGDTWQASHTFWITSVTSLLRCPGFSSRTAAWAALQAARMTSAFLPVTGAALSDCTTTVCATKAAKPSMCAPSSTLTRSPSLMEVESSWRGALQAQTSLREMVVGKASPLKVGFLLQTLESSSQICPSDQRQRSKILEPTATFLRRRVRTSLTILAEIWYFSMTPGVLRVSSSSRSCSINNRPNQNEQLKYQINQYARPHHSSTLRSTPHRYSLHPHCFCPLYNSLIILIVKMQAQEGDSEALFAGLSEANPKQLRQVIDVLITKSRVLIQNLEETWEKLEQSEREKAFWKENYYHLREATLKYADSNGLVPFDYIAALEHELRKEKVTKSCLEEKFKVMHPHAIHHTRHRQHPHATERQDPHSSDRQEAQESRQEGSQEEKEHSTVCKDVNKSNSTTHFKESPISVKLQSKHKIGPKNIEFFKFRETKMHQ